MVAGALSVFALQAHAEHSDIVFDIEDNQIIIEAGEHEHDDDGGEVDHSAPVLTYDGKLLFEGDFGDFGGLNSTDDPGYASHESSGVLNPGELIGFAGVGSLMFWDGNN